MTKQSISLITVAVLLASLYVAVFTDWFVKPHIQILPLIRPLQRNVKVLPGDVPVYPVLFQFDRHYKFTEIKVVAVDDEKTNKYPHAVWHMISDSNSIPTKTISYGMKLRGMKPKVPRAEPDQLEPDVVYRLYLTAGKARAQTNFQTREIVKPSQ